MIKNQANISGCQGTYTRCVNTLKQLQMSPTQIDTLLRGPDGH